MKKLDIVINGLRYVPQCEHGSEFTTEELLSRISSLVVKLEQKDIIIGQKDNKINELEHMCRNYSAVITEKDNKISDLELVLSRTEFEVAELTEEIEEKYNRISDLADTLDTIRSICEKGL